MSQPHSNLEPLDPLEVVRGLENQLFTNGIYDAQDLACYFVAEALSNGATEIGVLDIGHALVVSAETDWIPADVGMRAFTEVVSDDARGPNTMYAGVIATAIALKSATTVGGEPLPPPFNVAPKLVGRSVAFSKERARKGR